MHDGHHVLHHFLLRREALLVQHQQFAATEMRHVLEPLVPEPRQTVPMCQHQSSNLTSSDGVSQLQKMPPLEIEPATDLFDEFDIS